MENVTVEKIVIAPAKTAVARKRKKMTSNTKRERI